MKIKKPALISGILLISILSLIGIFRQEKTIPIGFIADFSAKSSNLGTLSRNGTLMAIDEINSRGGLWGRKLELISKDNGSNINQSRLIVQEFIDDNVILIIGPHLSRQANVLMEESKGKDLLVISPVVSTDNAVGIDDNFFRMNSSASDDGKTLASAVIDREDKNIAILWSHTNLEYTDYVVQGLKSELKKNNVNILYEKEFSGKEDFADIVDNLLQLDLDGIVISSISKDTASIVQLYAKNGELPHLYSCQWSMATDILSFGGKTVEDMILVGTYINFIPEPAEIEFEKKYHDLFATEPNFASVYAYETIMMFAEAVKQAGRNWDIKEIKEEIIKIRKFDGVSGEVEIDKYGDVKRKKSLYIIKNNAYELYTQD